MIYTENMQVLRSVLAVATILLAACASPTAPAIPDGAIRVDGTVRYITLEGGFWAVRGNDGVTYDPMNELSPEFQRENLRVTLIARIRNDVGGIHMVGPIVEVVSIHAR